jgi:dethiobiotin synthetase/adenosylmethionine--8-amino-7-oxononanoate aminotransferase
LGERLGSSQDFNKLSDIFDMAVSKKQGTHVAYKMYFRQVLEWLNRQGHKFGALMLEPILLGTGGMILMLLRREKDVTLT